MYLCPRSFTYHKRILISGAKKAERGGEEMGETGKINTLKVSGVLWKQSECPGRIESQSPINSYLFVNTLCSHKFLLSDFSALYLCPQWLLLTYITVLKFIFQSLLLRNPRRDDAFVLLLLSDYHNNIISLTVIWTLLVLRKTDYQNTSIHIIAVFTYVNP